MGVEEDELLAEPVARVRAPGCNEWWQRRGAYARGPGIELEFDRHVRRLDDSRQHNVVKVMSEPDELAVRLADAGWRAEFHATRWLLNGSARPD